MVSVRRCQRCQEEERSGGRARAARVRVEGMDWHHLAGNREGDERAASSDAVKFACSARKPPGTKLEGVFPPG
jgi:hypothetical protein